MWRIMHDSKLARKELVCEAAIAANDGEMKIFFPQ